jgi:hypothetical protein
MLLIAESRSLLLHNLRIMQYVASAIVTCSHEVCPGHESRAPTVSRFVNDDTLLQVLVLSRQNRSAFRKIIGLELFAVADALLKVLFHNRAHELLEKTPSKYAIRDHQAHRVSSLSTGKGIYGMATTVCLSKVMVRRRTLPQAIQSDERSSCDINKNPHRRHHASSIGGWCTMKSKLHSESGNISIAERRRAMKREHLLQSATVCITHIGGGKRSRRTFWKGQDSAEENPFSVATKRHPSIGSCSVSFQISSTSLT